LGLIWSDILYWNDEAFDEALPPCPIKRKDENNI
jgi:hypothetical protein